MEFSKIDLENGGFHNPIFYMVTLNRMKMTVVLKLLHFTINISVSKSTNVNYQNIRMTGRQTFDTRRVNISINYNFGKLKVEQRQVKDIAPEGKSGK